MRAREAYCGIQFLSRPIQITISYEVNAAGDHEH